MVILREYTFDRFSTRFQSGKEEEGVHERHEKPKGKMVRNHQFSVKMAKIMIIVTLGKEPGKSLLPDDTEGKKSINEQQKKRKKKRNSLPE